MGKRRPLKLECRKCGIPIYYYKNEFGMTYMADNLGYAHKCDGPKVKIYTKEEIDKINEERRKNRIVKNGSGMDKNTNQ